jgi:hypothetical protein
MITPRELEDLLRQCEASGQIRPGHRPQRRYQCDCGRTYEYVTDLCICSASHADD